MLLRKLFFVINEYFSDFWLFVYSLLRNSLANILFFFQPVYFIINIFHVSIISYIDESLQEILIFTYILIHDFFYLSTTYFLFSKVKNNIINFLLYLHYNTILG
jgi:hypothetical protein